MVFKWISFSLALSYSFCIIDLKGSNYCNLISKRIKENFYETVLE